LNELVPWDLLANGGLAGLSVFIGFAVVRGWLVPARSVQQLLDIYRNRIDVEQTRGNEWREAALTAQRANHDLNDQVVELTQTVHNVHDLLEQIQSSGRSG